MNNDYFSIASIKENNADSAHLHCPERYLWQAVLLQAWNDAKNRPRCGFSPIDKRQAFDFITKKPEEFILVCAAAGMDPDYLHDRIMAKFRKIGGGL